MPRRPARATTNWWLWSLISRAGKNTVNSSNSDRSTPVTLKSQVLPLLMEDRTLNADYGPNHPQVQAVRQRLETMRNFFVLPASASVARRSSTAAAISRRPRPRRGLRPVRQPGTRSHFGPGGNARQTVPKRARSGPQIEQLRNPRCRFPQRDRPHRSTLRRACQAIARSRACQGLRRIRGPGHRAGGRGQEGLPTLSLVSPGSILLSLLGGAGLAFLAEATDKSFRTLEEIRRRLGLPVMACIPAVAPDAAARKKRRRAERSTRCSLRTTSPGPSWPRPIGAYGRRCISAMAARATRWCSSPVPRRAKGNRLWQPTWRFPSLSRANGSCSSMPICGSRGCTKFFPSSSGLGLYLGHSGEAEYADAIQDTRRFPTSRSCPAVPCLPPPPSCSRRRASLNCSGFPRTV